MRPWKLRLLFVVSGLLVCSLVKMHFSVVERMQRLHVQNVPQTSAFHPSIKIINTTTFEAQTVPPPFPCVTAKLNVNLTFPICAYTAEEDKYVSAAYLAGGYFEPAQVKLVNIISSFATKLCGDFLCFTAKLLLLRLVPQQGQRQRICVEDYSDTFCGRMRDTMAFVHFVPN